MFLPGYEGYQWIVSPSQYATFTFWIIISIVIEIFSNMSAFADDGMDEFYVRPDYYCTDASMETIAAISSINHIWMNV
jgi:hypothetical protein